MKYLLLALALFSAPAFAACPPEGELPPNTICVGWQHPTENVDGSPIPDSGPQALQSFRIFYSTTEGEFNIGESLVVTDPTATEAIGAIGSIPIVVPPNGGRVDLYIVMTATNNLAETSQYSNTIMRSIDFPPPVPGAPVLQEVLINILFTTE